MAKNNFPVISYLLNFNFSGKNCILCRIILFCLIVNFYHAISFAQDIHFSQFYASPLTLNPAETGNYQGDWRLMNNFRTQWKAIGIPFRTVSLGYDHQFFFSNERFSAGAIVINDQSGDEKLMVNKFFVSGGYGKTFGTNDFHFGIQGGYILKNYNTSKMTFPNQFDVTKGEFDKTLPNNEKSLGDQTSFMDFNSGIAWTGIVGKFQPKVGFALFHLSKPGESFLKKNTRLSLRSVFHIGGKIDLDEKYFLMPNLFFMNNSKANDLLLGANLGMKLKENTPKIKSVFAGPLFRGGVGRNSDALIFIFGVNFLQLDAGLSYDINISTLRSSTRNRGALEFSIIFTNMSTRVTKVTTPCDRY